MHKEQPQRKEKVSSVRDNAVPPQRKKAVHYQRKEAAPPQRELRQGTARSKTETSRDHQVTSAGKKKSVTFGDPCAEEEKQYGKRAPTTGEVTSAAKTKTPIPEPRVSPNNTKQSDVHPP